MVISTFIKANTEWLTRAGQRWAAAATKLDGGTYDPKDFLGDVFASAVEDPLQWIVDLTRESQLSGIVITIPLVDNQGNSGYLQVPSPADTKVTSLMRLGGTQVMEQGIGKNVNVVTNVLYPPGSVVVDIRNLTSAAHPAGVYVGFLFEDKLVVSQIVVIRS